MRISTNMIYDRGVSTIQQLWASLLHTQQEVATGRRVLAPADDPIAASRALDVTQSRNVNAQFQTNQEYSADNLNLLENKLMGIGEILQYVRTSAESAGNPVLTQKELDFIVTDMRTQFDALLALSNTQDASGDFLFSGYKADVQPFQGSYGDVHYAGDQGMRTMQVSSTRFMPVCLPGSDVFDNTQTLKDAINVFAATGNSGAVMSASFNPPQPAATDTGRRYQVDYDGTNYNVIEFQPGNATPAPVTTATLIGNTLSFNGIDIDVTGAAAGDSFEIFVPSKNVFDNMAIFIDTLERPGSSGVISGVKFGMQLCDNTLDSTLRIRAQVGSQLVELEQLGNITSDMDLQYAETLKRLEDCDYAEAISRLTQLQTNLEAAQLSFMRVSNLSLFNYLQ